MLSGTQRGDLIKACWDTYKSYTALQLATTLPIGAPPNKMLLDVILNAIRQANYVTDFSINQRPYRLKLKQEDGSWQINLTDLSASNPTIPEKEISQCSEQEKLLFLCGQPFTLEAVTKDNVTKYAFSIQTQDAQHKPIKFGGLGKLDLYPEHLQTLFNIRQHLKQEGDLKSILIALATGAGKTFLQAAVMVALRMANVNNIFALPNRLIEQYINDVKKFLPDEIARELKILRQQATKENADAIKAMEVMKQPSSVATAMTVVASYEALLDTHYEKLTEIPADNLFLSFDEQHLVMNQEVRKLKLEDLAANKLTMFLTATPSEATYKLCGKPVASMSNWEKARAGHGKFPQLRKIRAEKIEDRMKRANYSLTPADAYLLLKVNRIVPPPESPIQTVFEYLQCAPASEFTDTQGNEAFNLRWDYQPPTVGKKILVVVESTDELINLLNFIKHTDPHGNFLINGRYKQPLVYKNGNIIERDLVYDALGERDNILDDKIAEKLAEAKQAQLAGENLPPRVPLKTQLDNNIFAGFVDYILCDITGFSVAQLNMKRRYDLNYLHVAVDAKLRRFAENTKDLVAYYQNKLTYHEEKNPGGIDAHGAEQVAIILAGIVTQFHNGRFSQNAIYDFFNNWTLDNEARQVIFQNNPGIKDLFDTYVEKHRVLYLMSGMEYAEVPLESKPFCGFEETKIPLRENGLLSRERKRRELTAFETFNPMMEEYHYKPRKLPNEVTEVIANNYFKFGFVGVYVGNRNTEGFSDLNLHTVISTVPTFSDPNNDPAKLIQGLGRLRGKDDTQQPMYICGHGGEVELSFDLEQLNKQEDYYPKYFRAKKWYNQRCVNALGIKIAEDINNYIYKTKGDFDEVNYQAYSDEVRLIVLRAYREIYNNNNYDVGLANKYLQQALKVASTELDKKMQKIETAETVPFLMNVVGKLKYAQSAVSYFRESSGKLGKFKQKAAEFRAAAARDHRMTNDILYADIIEKSDYQKLYEKSQTFIELAELFAKKARHVEFSYRKHLPTALTKRSKKSINDTIKTKILPLIVKYIHPEKQAYCLQEARKSNEWDSIFILNAELLKEFERKRPGAEGRTRADIAIALFRNMPTLTHYLDPKEDKYDLEKTVEKNREGLEEKLQQVLERGLVFDLAAFLSLDDQKNKQGFLYHIRPYLIPDDYALVERILTDQANANKFAAALLERAKYSSADELSDSEAQLAFFIIFFAGEQPAVKEIISIPARSRLLMREFQEINANIHVAMHDQAGSVFGKGFYAEAAALLQDAERDNIKAIFQNKLMPCLVLMFPSLNDKLTAAIAAYAKWDELCIELSYDQRLQKLMEATKPEEKFFILNEIAIDIFHKIEPNLSKEDLQAARIDYSAAVKTSYQSIQDMIAKIMQARFSQAERSTQLADYLQAGFLTDCRPLLVAPHYAALNQTFKVRENVEKFIASIDDSFIREIQVFLQHKFADAIKPFFYPEDFAKIFELLRDDKKSYEMAKYFYAADPDQSSDPEKILIEYLSTAGLTGIRSLRGHAEALNHQFTTISADVEKSTAMNQPELCFDLVKLSQHIADHLHPHEKASLNEYIKTALLPVLVKNFDPSVQKQIYDRVSSYDNWPALLFKYSYSEEIRLLQQGNIDPELGSSLFSNLSLNLIHDTHLVDDIPLAQYKRDYKDSVQNAAKTMVAKLQALTSPQNIARNAGKLITGAFKGLFSSGKTVKGEVGAQLLSNYIGGDFLQDIEPLFIEEDLIKLRQLCAEETIRYDFSKYLIDKVLAGEKIFGKSDQNGLLRLTKDFFATYQNGVHYETVKTIKAVPDRLGEAANELKMRALSYSSILRHYQSNPQYVSKIFTANPAQSPKIADALNANYKDKINTLAKDHLSKLLAACFKPAYQEMILKLCKSYDNWPALLLKNRNSLNQIKDINRATKKILKLLHQIPGLENLTREQCIDFNENIQVIKSSVSEIEVRAKNDFSDPAKVLQQLQRSFQEIPIFQTLQPAPAILAAAEKELSTESRRISAELSDLKGNPKRLHKIADTLNPEYKDSLSKLCKDKLVPILLSCVHPRDQARVRRACVNYDRWPALILKYQSDLESLNSNQLDRYVQVVFQLLNDIPALQGKLDPARNAQDPAAARAYLQTTFPKIKSLDDPFDKRSIDSFVEYIRDHLIYVLRDSLIEDDWTELCNILFKQNKVRNFAKEFIRVSAAARAAGRKVSKDDLMAIISNAMGRKIDTIDVKAANINMVAELLLKDIKAGNDTISAEKKSELIKREILSVLELKAFKATIIDTLEHLSNEQISFYLRAFDGEAKQKIYALPQIEQNKYYEDYAHNIIRLLNLVKENKFADIYSEFMEKDIVQAISDSVDQKPVALKNIGFFKLWALIMEIHKDQIRCHEFFNNEIPVDEAGHAESNKLPILMPASRGGTMFDVTYRMSANSVTTEIRTFRLNSQTNSNQLNNEVKAAQQQKVKGLLGMAKYKIIDPICAALSAPNKKDSPPKPKSPMQTAEWMKYDAYQLGLELAASSPMRTEDVKHTTFIDMVDPMILSITKNRNISFLARWWRHVNPKEPAGAFARSKSLQDLDHFVNFCNVKSNASLLTGYNLAGEYLRTALNPMSAQDMAVVRLRRKLYAQMAYNTATKYSDYYYAAIVENIKDYMGVLAEKSSPGIRKELRDVQFKSSTMNTIKSILLNDALSPIQKLIKIQFSAADYYQGTMHSFQRSFSQLFSKESAIEGALVNDLCQQLKNADFSGSVTSSTEAPEAPGIELVEWLNTKLLPSNVQQPSQSP